MKKFLTALVLAVLMSGAACHKDNKAAQLEALYKAYQSGVFTKEEYDSKKQALLGTAGAPAPAAAPTPANALPPAAGASSPLANRPPAAPGGSDVPAPSQAVPEASQQPMAMPPAPAQAMTSPPPPPAPKPAARPRAAASTPPAPAGAMAQPPVSGGAMGQPPVPAGAMTQPPMQTPPQYQQPPQQQQQPQYQQPPQPAGAAAEEPEPAPMPGCEDAESRSGGPKGKMERFFPASEDQVRRAANTALSTLDFVIHRSDPHEIEASKRKHLSAVVGAGGEHMILHFASAQRNGQRGTLVSGETKKTLMGRLAQKSWTAAVMAQISCNLRSGR